VTVTTAQTGQLAKALLIVDDESERLTLMTEAVRGAVGHDVEVRSWRPEAGKTADPLDEFNAQVDEVGLVVTDDDLSRSRLGLYGASITSWAQDRFVPVCTFSRQLERKLPRERNFFQLRVPHAPDDTTRAAFVARIYRGFEELRGRIAAIPDARPTARLLADAMGVPELEDDLAPYLSSVASANSSLRQAVAASGNPDDVAERENFLSFLLGHVIVNAVLQFPGPILHREALAAYCALDASAGDKLGDLFAGAEYVGPFSAPGKYFVRRQVDERIDDLAEGWDGAAEDDELASEIDHYNRSVVERVIGGARHSCDRCGGTRGGFWCPYSRRPVCGRTDCSVGSTSWVPRGATLCRVEKDYFDEWAPLLGE